MQGKKTLKSLIICGLSVSLILLTSGFVHAKKIYVMKAASANPPGSLHIYYLEKFKEFIEKDTNGQIQVKIFPGGQLGTEQDNVEAVSTGMIQASTLAVNNVTPFAPIVGFLTLPYIFPDIDAAYRVFKSPLMDEVNTIMEKQANMRSIGWLVGGYRAFLNSKRPVTKPSDLKGLKIRVPKNSIMLASYKAWGVDAIPMAWTEVFNALQQKVVDGLDCNHPVSVDQKFWEVTKYITNIHYILWTGPCIVNANWYNNLPKDLQKAVDVAGKKAAQAEWDYVATEEQKSLEKLLSKGMEIVEPADGEKEWIEKARAIWPKFYDEIGGKEMVDKAMAVIAK